MASPWNRRARQFFLFGGLPVLIVIGLIASACGAEPTATPPPTSTLVPPTATARPAQPTATPAPTATATSIPTATPLQPKLGGTLRERLLRPYEPFDSYHRPSQFGVEHIQLALSNLIAGKAGEPGILEPDLAQSWDISQDGLTITLSLRRGVTWGDGKPFTAKDVLFNIDRAKNPPSETILVNAATVKSITSFTAPDDNTVVLKVSAPSNSFIAGLASPFLLMYPPQVVKVPGDWQKNPVSTGAYRLDSYTPDVSIVYKKNPNYYKTDSAGRKLPYLDAVNGFFIFDRAAAQAAFKSGQLDCGCGYDFVTPAGEELQKAVPGSKLTISSGISTFIFFNKKAPWDDIKVRKAVQSMFDFRAVGKLSQGGKGFYPPTVMLPSELGGAWGVPGSDILNLPGYKGVTAADRAAGIQALKDLGVDPSKTKVVLPLIDTYSDTAQAIDDQFRQMGFQTQLQVLTPAQYTAAQQQGQYDVTQYFAGQSDDPFGRLATFVFTDSAENYGKWSFPAVEALLKQQDVTFDPAKRKDLMLQYQRQLVDLAVWLPTWNTASSYLLSPAVEGFKAPPYSVTAHSRLETVWLNRQ